jgi:CheY-like chemotaxis protein
MADPVPECRRTLRVLVVDDDCDTADSLALLIDFWGYEPRVARDGRQALTAAVDFLPDVVLLDLALPGLDGYGLAACLRADPQLADTALVAVTGYADDDSRRRSGEAGIACHLVKPVDPAEIQALLMGLADDLAKRLAG